jgi:hypothetical protein
MVEFDEQERRLIGYALAYLASEFNTHPDLVTEAAQEVAPETCETGEPLPDVRALLAQVAAKFG